MPNAASSSASQSSVFKFRSWVRLAFVTSVTCTPPRGPPVKFHRRKVSIFPKSSSPPAAFSRAPAIFSSSQRSFRLLKYVLSGSPVCGRKRSCPPSLAKRATSSATRVSCQTIALAEDGGLPLIGDADRGQIRSAQPALLERFCDHFFRAAQDFQRIMLHPAR